METKVNEEVLERRINTVASMLDERQKRIYLAAEAESLGWGGMTTVARLAGVDKDTLTPGKIALAEERSKVAIPEPSLDDTPESKQKHREWKEAQRIIPGNVTDGMRRQRKAGGGRKSIEETQPGITEALLNLVKDECYGNPENPLQWTLKSSRMLADELTSQGWKISHAKVGELLAEEGFTLQQNRKLNQVGKDHEDRDAQFRHINDTVLLYQEEGLPAVSIDCKKKEIIGNYKNGGAEYAPSGEPVAVNDHDWGKQKAAPYGVYDLSANEGFVNVGISSDTAQFAVQSIRCWWNEMGKERYPDAKKLYITADGGGSNGTRCKLWKTELQKLSTETGLAIEVSHFPPGTSKWNKIEHRMFSWISFNWRARPLKTLAIIVNLIGSTTNKKGLLIKCKADLNEYKTKISVSDEELENVIISRNDFHGEWNYTIYPSKEAADSASQATDPVS